MIYICVEVAKALLHFKKGPFRGHIDSEVAPDV